MCGNIIIDGVEHDDFGGECSCCLTWLDIMKFIGRNTERIGINEQMVIRRDECDYRVTIERVQA